jgi:uncharacterized lipoprotein YmbA
MSIGINPIVVPAYLDRPQIVTRIGANELEMAKFHCWAEPMEDSLGRVLAEDLSNLLFTRTAIKNQAQIPSVPSHAFSVFILAAPSGTSLKKVVHQLI